MSDEIKIKWICGCYVGEPCWLNEDYYECDECDTEFETEDALDNWQEKMCSATCPNCGAELTQKYDNPKLINED